MSYKVLHTFVEVEHDNNTYEKGDLYPKENFKADPERVSFLQSNQNRYNMRFLGKEIKPKNSDEGQPKVTESNENNQAQVPDPEANVDEQKEKVTKKTQSKGKEKSNSSEKK